MNATPCTAAIVLDVLDAIDAAMERVDADTYATLRRAKRRLGTVLAMLASNKQAGE